MSTSHRPVPRPVVQFQPRKSTESRFDSAQVKSACLAINTADYCQTTAMEVGTSTAILITLRIDRFNCFRSSWKKRSEKGSRTSIRKTYPCRRSLTYSQSKPVITQKASCRSYALKCDFRRHCGSTEGIGSDVRSLVFGNCTHHLVSAEFG